MELARSVSLSLVVLSAATAVRAQSQSWILQFGTAATDDAATAVASDGAGGVFVAGWTQGSFAGPSSGGMDAWVTRRDGSGLALWSRQFGTSSGDETRAAAPDGQGGVLLAGTRWNSTQNDAWVARYDSGGNPLWSRTFGNSSASDYLYGAATDSAGGVYLCGTTFGALGGAHSGGRDAWVARYDGGGNPLWIRQLGTPSHEVAAAIASDASGAFVVGYTEGALAGPNAGFRDLWIARYGTDGTQVWTRQLGGPFFDGASAVAADGQGGCYVAGAGATGLSESGTGPLFLARFDVLATERWVRRFGVDASDVVASAALDALGGVWLAGATYGDLAATNPNPATTDAWVERYDAAGNRTYSAQWGSDRDDSAESFTAGAGAERFVAGRTYGSLAGVGFGNSDGWLARLDAPAFYAYCTAGTTSGGCTPSASATGLPSASNASGFTVSCTALDANRSGLLFFGVAPHSIAWTPQSSSTRCVATPVQRTNLLASGGGSGCTGSFALDWNQWRATTMSGPLGAWSAGQTYYGQWWFRDPLAPGASNASDALAYTLQP